MKTLLKRFLIMGLVSWMFLSCSDDAAVNPVTIPNDPVLADTYKVGETLLTEINTFRETPELYLNENKEIFNDTAWLELKQTTSTYGVGSPLLLDEKLSIALRSRLIRSYVAISPVDSQLKGQATENIATKEIKIIEFKCSQSLFDPRVTYTISERNLFALRLISTFSQEVDDQMFINLQSVLDPKWKSIGMAYVLLGEYDIVLAVILAR
ncbi:hypothetical protein OAT16_11395 [Prolixibacteraceae bacterium]|nr:hypothetical protein [Prolixibacteraceae bacterium]